MKKKIKGTAFYLKSHFDLFFNTFSAKVTELSIKLTEHTSWVKKNEYQKFYSGQLLKNYLYLNVQ